MAKDTKQRLADSLKQLLLSKPLDRITVKEIVEGCGINRQTFYYNFHDIYALLDWIFQKELTKIGVSDPDCPWQECFRRTIQYMKENQRIILNVYRSIGRMQLEQYLTGALMPVMRKQVCLESEGLSISAQDQEFVAALHTAGFLGMIFSWLDKAMSSEIPIPLDRFIALIDGSLRAMLERIAQMPAVSEDTAGRPVG